MSLDVKKIIGRLKLVFGFKRDGELAKALGVANNTLSAWKSRGNIDLKSILMICEKKEVSIDWLLFGKGEMYSKVYPAQESENDVIKKINQLLETTDVDQRRDVLKYAEKEELFRKLKELYEERVA